MRRAGSLLPLAAVLFAALIAVSAAPGQAPSPAEKQIVIFHINDVHGKIDNFAKVAAILDAERKTGGDVFFFSAGDNFTGDPVIDRADPPGEPMVELLDRLHLDLLSLGNHEFDYGLDAVRKLVAHFPTISANIAPEPGILPGLKPYVVLTSKSGVKLVVFGSSRSSPATACRRRTPTRSRACDSASRSLRRSR